MNKTIAERVVALEVQVVDIIGRIDNISMYTMELLFFICAGLAAVAFLVFKRRNNKDD